MFALFGRNFAGTLPELAETFLPELILSPPPQKRNQTLLLSKLSSLSELARTCRNSAGTLPELVGTVGTFGSWSFHLVPLAPLASLLLPH